MAHHMDIRTRVDGEVQILDLEGGLMLGAGDLLLRETVRQLIDAGNSKIVLNLEELTRVDSSGLGEILASKKAALGGGGDLKLMRPGKYVHGILMASRLTDVLSVFDSEADAVDSF